MLNFLFWNLYNKPLEEEVAALCYEHEVDILILAESESSRNSENRPGISEKKLLLALNKGKASKFESPFNPKGRLKFYVKFPPEHLEPILDLKKMTIRRLTLPDSLDILIVAVHLSSKRDQQDIDQALLCLRYADYIREAESKVGLRRSLVVGDFNMNPFEYGVVSSEGFHALMDRKLVAEKTRTVQKVERKYFYNPMWGRMGDKSPGPPGSYYYRKAVPVCYFWNTFDQVLLSPELLEYFPDDRLRVIDNISGRSLLSKGKPDEKVFSDHLPLFFSLKIEKET